MRLEPRPFGVRLALEHRTNLGQHALVQHGVEARLDALAQPGAVGSEQDSSEGPGRGLAFDGLPIAEGTATGEQDLPGAYMALAIARLELGADRRIAFGEARAERLGAHRLPVAVGL